MLEKNGTVREKHFTELVFISELFLKIDAKGNLELALAHLPVDFSMSILLLN